MSTFIRGKLPFVAVAVAVLLWGARSRAEDEEKKVEAPKKNVRIPADLKGWKIEFNGIAGTPSDREGFWVTVDHAGTMLVERKRVGSKRGKIYEGKLSEAETRRFFEGAAKVVNEFHSRKNHGTMEDGWQLVVKVSATKAEQAENANFENQDKPSEAVAPGFGAMVQVIRSKIPWGNFDHLFPGLRWDRGDEEEKKDEAPLKKVRVPADLKDWNIEFSGFAGTPADRDNLHITVAHDGTMLRETWRGRNGPRTTFKGKLTEEETRRFFDGAAMVINNYKPWKSEGTLEDGWELSVKISAKKWIWSKEATFEKQQDPSDKVAPGFDAMLKVINERIRRGDKQPD